MKTFTLALIGRGRWGSNIQRTLASIPDVILAASVSHDWRPLLKRRDLDGVLIATPASTHAAIAAHFLRRGIPLFIEKPLTSSLRDARVLQRAAQRHRTPVMVGHVHLYNPAYQAAKRGLRHAGRIRWIFGEGMNQGPIRDDISCLWDWAPHDLSMTLDLLGEEPVAVQATGAALLRSRTRLYDIATLSLRFPSGVRFIGIYSWLAPTKRKRLTIMGDRRSIILDDTAKRKVTVITPERPPVFPRYAAAPPLTAELQAFVRMLRTHARPVSNLAQGVAVVRILDAAEKSIRADGKSVAL